MLPNIVRLSFRATRSAEFLRVVSESKTIMRYRYSKWISRKPVSIINENELYDTEDTMEMKELHRKASREYRQKLKLEKETKKIEKNEEITAKEPIYKALKEDDKLISSLMISVKSRKLRQKNNIMLLEGYRLIEDAIQAGAKPKVILFTRLADVLSLLLPKEVELYKIPYRTIQLWSNLITSPGILGIFEIPNIETKKTADDAIPLTIICDNVREPGNLGTIVRIAAAVGCEKLLLMKGCADLWDPKVLRSAVGAHFRLPIFASLTWDEIPTLISNESEIFLADNNTMYDSEPKNHTENDVESDISTSTEARCIDTENDNLGESIGNKSESNDEISRLIVRSNKPTAKTKLFVKKIISQLSVVPYHTLDFTKKEMVLVIGGETEGISLQSCELLRERNCTRVNISLFNGVNSLNTASALSIIAFEARKQFMTRQISDE